MGFNTCSAPSELKITDLRFVDICGAPKRCTLLKIMTNQGICGFGEVRDAASKTYALMLKSRILGENPCDVDRIFHKIKQFHIFFSENPLILHSGKNIFLEISTLVQTFRFFLTFALAF